MTPPVVKAANPCIFMLFTDCDFLTGFESVSSFYTADEKRLTHPALIDIQ